MWMRLVALSSLFIVVFSLSSPWAISQEGVPAYNAAPPAKGEKLPPLLGKDDLWGNNARYDYQTHAYELAKKIQPVIYQQPCYCHCDHIGHKSLHSCFENTHGAECDVCQKELYYSYAQTKAGKSAKQIREGIIKGEWRQVDLQTAAQMN